MLTKSPHFQSFLLRMSLSYQIRGISYQPNLREYSDTIAKTSICVNMNL